MAEGYTFKISGNVAAYAAAVGQIPGVTDKAAAAAALKMGQQFAKMQADAAKSAKKAADSTGKAFEDTAGKLGSGAAKLKGALDLVAPGAGGLAGVVNDLADAAEVLGPQFAIAAAGVVAFGGAFAAPIAGALALSAALTKTAFSAEENLKALEGFKAIGSDFYPAIPPETVASFKALAVTEDALISIGERLSLSAASSVAPSLERVADTVVGLALQGERLFEKFAKGQNLFEVLATQTLAAFAQALTLPMAPIVALGDAFAKLSEITGVQLPAGAKAAIADLDRLRDGQYSQAFGRDAVAALENSDAMRALSGALSGATAEGAAFIATQERVTAAQKNAGKAAKESAAEQKKAADQYKADLAEEEQAQAAFASGMAALAAESKKASDAQLSGIAAIKQARADDLAALQATYQATLAQAGGDQQRLAAITAFEAAKFQVVSGYEAKITAAEKAEDAARVKAAQDASAAKTASIVGYVQASSATLAGLSGSFGQLLQSIDPEGHERAYKAIWAAQKAAAIATATVNAALAVSQALGSAPPPLNYALAAAAGVAGAVSVATVASSPAPKFHTGTMFASPAGALRADEFQATLQRGEIVVDRQTASRPGVREAVASMSTGAPAGRATHPDDVADGMDRSSVPAILQSILVEFRRQNRHTPSAGRPGHRPSYGY